MVAVAAAMKPAFTEAVLAAASLGPRATPAGVHTDRAGIRPREDGAPPAIQPRAVVLGMVRTMCSAMTRAAAGAAGMVVPQAVPTTPPAAAGRHIMTVWNLNRHPSPAPMVDTATWIMHSTRLHG